MVIIGDGPIGCLHIEIARARGASKIILVGRGKIALVPQFKPHHLIKNTDEQKTVEEVLNLTDGIGADIAICAVPEARPQQQAVDMVRKRGKVIIYGGVAKKNPMTTLDSNKIHYNELSVIGSFSYPSTGLEKALKFIHEGKITASMYVSKKVTLDQVVEGMKYSKEGKALKVVIKPWE